MVFSYYLFNRTKDLPGIKVMGNPETSIIAWESDTFDIYRLQDAMTKKGWQVNALQFPSRYSYILQLVHDNSTLVKYLCSSRYIYKRCFFLNSVFTFVWLIVKLKMGLRKDL